jgi:hypothetical protein
LNIIARARADDPAARYADADAFRRALVDATSDATRPHNLTVAPAMVAPRTTPSRPARRPARRVVPAATAQRLPARTVAWAAALTLALLLLVGGGLVAPRVISRDPAAPAAAAAAAPNLTGMTFAQALDVCAARGLTVERVDVVYGPGPLNQVVDQTPAPGKPLHAGDAIQLVVRTGR